MLAPVKRPKAVDFETIRFLLGHEIANLFEKDTCSGAEGWDMHPGRWAAIHFNRGELLVSEIEGARKLVEAGKPAEALLILTSALRNREDSELWNDWASVAFACGDSELAESGYRRALELDSSHRQAAINLAALLLTQKRFEESLPVIQPLVASLNQQEKEALRQLATDAQAQFGPPSLPASGRMSPVNVEGRRDAPSLSRDSSLSKDFKAPCSQKPVSVVTVHLPAIKIGVITPSRPERHGLLT